MSTPGMDGVVMNRKVFSRKERDEKTRKADKEKSNAAKKRASERIRAIEESRNEQILDILDGVKLGTIRDIEDDSVAFRAGTMFNEKLLEKIEFEKHRPEEAWVDNTAQSNKIDRLRTLVKGQRPFSRCEKRWKAYNVCRYMIICTCPFEEMQ